MRKSGALHFRPCNENAELFLLILRSDPKDRVSKDG
jgi:hypothetical protein